MTDIPCDDPIVEASVAMLRARSRAGTAKYGTTLAASPEGFDAFLRHLSEELADALNYTEKLRTLRQSSDIPAMRRALEEASIVFKRYARHHDVKGDTVKAASNSALAVMCDEALNGAEATADPRDALIERMAEGMRYYAEFFGIGGPNLPDPVAYDAFQCLAAYHEWKGTKP